MEFFEETKIWFHNTMLEGVSKRIRERGMECRILKDRDELAAFLEKKIPPTASVALAGSVSLRELQVDDFFRKRGNKTLDHWPPELTVGERDRIRREQLTADFFFSSVNALTTDGQIINIDGTGNRVAGMIFGPGEVLLVVGINKIVKNYEEAIWRIRNIATPQNARRLGIRTPCSEFGYCINCETPQKICRVTTIIEYQPAQTPLTVLLLPLVLGF